MRILSSGTTPGGLTILTLETTSTPAFATYEGVSALR
jgi:hypothetical protein